ncbi:alpha/beta hydrolase [Weizmannia acidilactici]|uniref:alpha/beta hydrolase n=1 Tax=Weizmannia acidilactici TaxID=2607726 RepID=UPI00124ED972|nr:alpha/beta hydrolase [Weizmannia acidilactici]GER66099.1 alpha/beta hydrolase [Weizmannia acidilactici]GER72408.1 alpha/beta hydrolase [Weizmannia acidilactici]
MKKVLSFLGTAALSAGALGFYISEQVMHMRKKDEHLIIDREVAAKRLDLEAYASLPKEEVWILSPFGYMLKSVWVKPYPDSKKFMIFCHGVTENKMNSIKYMNVFLKRGFNAILYDHRRHGESGGKSTSYGYYEKFDLKAVVDALLAREGEDIFFGIHGESMGAATLLLYAGQLCDRADFYIADCPFSSFRTQLIQEFTHEAKLPGKWFFPLADLFVRIRDGYSLRHVSPIDVVDRIRKPVLFIHSAKDDYILPEMTKALYEKKRGPKQLFIAENGAHAQSFNLNREQYEKAVDEFLENIVLGNRNF